MPKRYEEAIEKNKNIQEAIKIASNAGGMGLIPGLETKIPHAAECSQKKKRKKKYIYIYVYSKANKYL